ncbi:hypothetical protein J437_LFUL007284 [Ladona fulva]|uniref:Cytochrome P450 n=1 Tax=Ladona fulva TaxID=123851 RepID=A0A8K0K1J5_LADFU|nr:hypothetical protein J437_LFUL007284 [Ladona fulva]
MGIKLDREDEEQRKYIAAIYDYGTIFYNRIAKPWYGVDILFKLSPLARRQTETLKILHGFTEKVRSSRKRVKAFLELLIELSMEENLLSDQEIREEVDTFMFEGHDTTSMAICWTMLMLANHPDIQEKVREEVDACFEGKVRSTGADSSEESAAKMFAEMPLLERCIKETLRLYPSVPFISRVLTEDFQMEKYLIPAGTMVNVVINGIHRNPNTFPDPDKFDPDRFLPEAGKDRHTYAYVPFAAGPRNCIGQKFAMLELKCVISTIIRRYKLIAVDKPEDVGIMHDIVLRPCNGIRIKLETRDLP